MKREITKLPDHIVSEGDIEAYAKNLYRFMDPKFKREEAKPVEKVPTREPFDTRKHTITHQEICKNLTSQEVGNKRIGAVFVIVFGLALFITIIAPYFGVKYGIKRWKLADSNAALIANGRYVIKKIQLVKTEDEPDNETYYYFSDGSSGMNLSNIGRCKPGDSIYKISLVREKPDALYYPASEYQLAPDLKYIEG